MDEEPRLIDTIIAAVAFDPDDNTEGVCAVQTSMGWMPLIAADKERFKQIEELAEGIALTQGRDIRLVRFTERTEVRLIKGRKT